MKSTSDRQTRFKISSPGTETVTRLFVGPCDIRDAALEATVPHPEDTVAGGSAAYFFTLNIPSMPKLVYSPVIICSKCSLYF
jgi:hypothetical protein